MTDHEKPFGDDYPLLTALVRQRGMKMKGIWRHEDLAQLFDASIRTLQEWEANPEKEFSLSDLPGGAGLLSVHLEEFLRNSRGRRRRRHPKLNSLAWDALQPQSNSKQGKEEPKRHGTSERPPKSG